MAEDVLRELGHIIVGLLPLRNIVLGTFRVDRHLHRLSQARVAELWPRLAPLLVAPFLLSRQDLLLLRHLRLPSAQLRNGAYRIGDPIKKLSSAIVIGALPNLTNLLLFSQRIGHDEIISLSNAIKPTTGNPMGALPQLEQLDLSTNRIGDVGMQAFASAIANGALQNLKELNLYRNNISDSGMVSFVEAVRSGALQNLKELELFQNDISDAGMAAFAEAVRSTVWIPSSSAQLRRVPTGAATAAAGASATGPTSTVWIMRSGSLANLSMLSLSDNKISDAGMISLSEAFRSGALPNLNILELGQNQIGNRGMSAFSKHVRGALLKLQTLDLGDNMITGLGIMEISVVLWHGALPKLESICVTGNMCAGSYVFRIKTACAKRGIRVV